MYNAVKNALHTKNICLLMKTISSHLIIAMGTLSDIFPRSFVLLSTVKFNYTYQLEIYMNYNVNPRMTSLKRIILTNADLLALSWTLSLDENK